MVFLETEAFPFLHDSRLRKDFGAGTIEERRAKGERGYIKAQHVAFAGCAMKERAFFRFRWQD